MNLKSWLLAFRPKTLTAAVVPIFVGTALARAYYTEVYIVLSVMAGLAAIFIQIATNLINDSIDFAKGADTEHRVGPQRVTQSGLLTSQSVMLGGFFFLALAVVCGIPLVLRGGLPIFYIGIPSLLLAYGYTGGPFPLAYRGLGDLFVVLFFGIIAVGGVYYLQTLEWSWPAGVAGLQVGFLATVLIAINNMRDMEQDKLVNKKTLAVRFGIGFARAEIIGLISMTFVLNAFWWVNGHTLAALLPLITLPLAIRLIKIIRTVEPSAQMNSLLAQAAALQLGFGLLLSVGLAL